MVELMNQLKQAKAESGMTFEDLAAMSGVGYSTMKRWFNAERMPPRMQNFIDVAQCLGLEVSLVRVVK